MCCVVVTVAEVGLATCAGPNAWGESARGRLLLLLLLLRRLQLLLSRAGGRGRVAAFNLHTVVAMFFQVTLDLGGQQAGWLSQRTRETHDNSMFWS